MDDFENPKVRKLRRAAMTAEITPAFKRIRQAKMIRAYASLRAAYVDYQRWQDGDGDAKTFLHWVGDVVPELEREYPRGRVP